MAERMPPPGKSGKATGVMIAVGVPKPNASTGSRMPPPGSQSDAHGGKVTPDEAAVVREDQHCIDCQMYHPDTGECDKVEGQLAPQDGCHMYFTPVADDDGPDADEQGEVSDNDADDQQSQMPMGGR